MPEITLDVYKAGERGVFGSPTFIVGEDVFFGNDRLEFLEERLRS